MLSSVEDGEPVFMFADAKRATTRQRNRPQGQALICLIALYCITTYLRYGKDTPVIVVKLSRALRCRPIALDRTPNPLAIPRLIEPTAAAAAVDIVPQWARAVVGEGVDRQEALPLMLRARAHEFRHVPRFHVPPRPVTGFRQFRRAGGVEAVDEVQQVTVDAERALHVGGVATDG